MISDDINEYMRHMAFYLKQAGEIEKLYKVNTASIVLEEHRYPRKLKERISEAWERLDDNRLSKKTQDEG